ncbi:hypothetical protein V9K67_26685 [Paraflavisolibacter sp. H34]|uniref:hypothetical protein n=1 Tax=Huijunlia imazamoxiresistens TaxID=3127457 RepID=UPI00301A824B
MAVHDIFSKRGELGKELEIYVYDSLPNKLRVQIHHILRQTIGNDNYSSRLVKEIYKKNTKYS